jgi:PAS domain S-box-containing protein
MAAILFVGTDGGLVESAPSPAAPRPDWCRSPLLHALCRRIVADGVPRGVADVRAEPLAREDPILQGAGAAALLGVPLQSSDEPVPGVLCVLDTEPRTWSSDEIRALEDLAAVAGDGIGFVHERAERQRVEAELQRSEAREREILESIDDGFYALDREGRFTYVNQHAERLWGRRRADLLGRKAAEIFPQWVGSDSYLAHERALALGRSQRLETVSAIVGLPVEIRIFPSPSGLAVYFRDMTEQKRLEQALRERDETLALAERSAGIGVWDSDPATGMVRGTPQFFRLMGLEPTHELVPIEMLRALRHPLDRDRVLEGFHRAVASGADVYDSEYRIIRPDDGRMRWIFGRGRIVRDARGTPVRYSGIDIDVTERRAAAEALAESEVRMAFAQEAVGIGTWDRDIVTGASRWSAEQFRLHGLDPATDMASHDAWLRAILPADRAQVDAAVAEAVDRRGPYAVEYRVALPDGRVLWLAQRGKVIMDEAGRPVRMIGISLDVSERHAAAAALAAANAKLEQRVAERTRALETAMREREAVQAQLQQAQKMEALGRLTGGVAHDFNNLLAVVLTNLRLLRKRLDREEGPRRLVDAAIQGAARGADLTQRLLAFARRQELAASRVEVPALVRGISELLTRTLGPAISLELDFPADLPPVRADAGQLELAILNLAVNARDAMPLGGVLAIGARAEQVPAGHPTGLPPGGYVCLGVVDTGTGMDEATLARAAEPFFTTKGVGKGTGLGLPMVDGFAAQSGGALRLESRPGRGTRAELWLPRAAAETAAPGADPAPVAPAVSPSPPSIARRGRLRVLAVDDDALVLMGTSAMLAELGHEVVEAYSAAEALEKLRAGERVDLVLTDQAMPGMTGVQLAAAIEGEWPGLPVLLATGYAELPEGAGRGLQRLTKPFDDGALAAAIAGLVDGPSTSGKLVPVRAG